MSAKCPSIKRIQKEIIEIQSDSSEFYTASPLEDNLFEWHFTIAGPKDTEFEGGLYHGQILLPPEYPFKPPWVVFKTPNGRFQLNQKICLSVTAYHPEEWNPSWGIRTVLLGIISHFPTEDKSSIGYLGYSKEERAQLARESGKFVCPVCKISNDKLLECGATLQESESSVLLTDTSLQLKKPTSLNFSTTAGLIVASFLFLLIGVILLINKSN